jgi:putative transcriptional regulator
MFQKNEVPTQIVPTSFSGTGCVLLAQPGEYDHYLMKAAVLIFEHHDRGTSGVIIDKPSAFSVGELSPGLEVFKANTLFLGGPDGNDLAIMIHTHPYGGLTKDIGYGLYVGGVQEARTAVTNLQVPPSDFKFFFNNVGWEPGKLQKEINEGRWDVCVIPPRLILYQESNRLWSKARQALQNQKGLKEPIVDDE